MGCDIHMVLERKMGDRWIGVRDVEHFQNYRYDEETKSWKREFIWCRARQRNYDLFAKLAGVRGDGPDAKGMPGDASELAVAMSEQWGGDGHSHSYCLLQEFLENAAASERNPAEVFLAEHPAVSSPFTYFFGMYEPEENEEYRVVFWFDN